MNSPATTAGVTFKRGASAPRGTLGTGRVCRECGKGIPARHGREFCTDICRRSFHNRKAQRGALLFDVLMALRFDRSRAKDHAALSLLCRMASAFRAQDVNERGARRSWDDIADVRERNARFLASVVGKNVAGNRAGRARP
jgi:hypothetical protein